MFGGLGGEWVVVIGRVDGEVWDGPGDSGFTFFVLEAVVGPLISDFLGGLFDLGGGGQGEDEFYLLGESLFGG